MTHIKKVHNPYLRIIHRKTYNPDFKAAIHLQYSHRKVQTVRAYVFTVSHTPRGKIQKTYFIVSI